jgi:hypothetical protein
MVNPAERRRAQRVDAHLPLLLHLDPGGDADGPVAGLETINISASGVYFRSPRFLEPMTKLAMSLELSVPGPDEGPVTQKFVECQGLVVRVQPEQADPKCEDYEVAVFFTWIDPVGQTVLQQHIDLCLGTG